MSTTLQMHFHEQHRRLPKREASEEQEDKMNLQVDIQPDQDDNSCGTSISNSLDNDSDLENDHPTLVPENPDPAAEAIFPVQDIKKEFPLEFGLGVGKAKKDDDVIANFPGTSTRSPFLLPAQLYKNFFASFGKRKRVGPDSECPAAGFQVYPRNMLFSTGNRGGGFFFGGSDDESGERVTDSPVDEKSSASSAFVWSGGGGGGGGGGVGVQGGAADSQSPGSDVQGAPSLPPGSSASVVGQNPTQGLVHWMSVMAEHMGAGGHHDPSAVGVHYGLPWNGGVEQCGQHKDGLEYSGWPRSRNAMAMKQGYEAKMNTSDPLGAMGHQKSAGEGDRLSLAGHHHHHHHQSAVSQMLYGAAGLTTGRSGSSSSSPAGGAGSSLLVVPQPKQPCSPRHGVGGPAGSGSRKYHCKMCPQVNDRAEKAVFGSKADLQLHTQVHLREAKPYKCSQCTKAFANSSYLSQHTRIHLGIKPYRCEICQRKFTQLSHLQQHIRTHTGDKPYKCRHPGCQKAFSQLSNLQSHSRCHQTDKPYKCNSCYKCFSDEPSLLEHIPKHKESKHLKTHICQYCGKSYTQETYLSKHMQKHAERADRRPPIAGLAGRGPPGAFPDHPYWPKISPDSAAHLSEMQESGGFGQQGHDGGDEENDHLQAHHRALFEHHRLNGGELTNSEDGARQTLHLNGQSSVPVPTSGYDIALSKASAAANSAFTPINSMAPHLGGLTHPQLGQRPSYLYDSLGFQQSKQPPLAAPAAASFPNQLISLHQIRNYAHQPTANLLSPDHLLPHSLAVKDKQ